MELYLIRHGQSEGNISVVSVDPPLTDLGKEQAQLVATRMSTLNIDAVFCSPLTRALQTASFIGDALKLPYHVVPDLAEQWGNGPWDVLGSQEIQCRFPRTIVPPEMSEPWWPPRAEEETDAYARASRVEAFLRARYEATDKHVMVVSHGTFGAILISTILGALPCGYTRFSQRNACVSQIEMLPGRVKLRYLNDVSHLSEYAWT